MVMIAAVDYSYAGVSRTCPPVSLIKLVVFIFFSIKDFLAFLLSDRMEGGHREGKRQKLTKQPIRHV